MPHGKNYIDFSFQVTHVPCSIDLLGRSTSFGSNCHLGKTKAKIVIFRKQCIFPRLNYRAGTDAAVDLSSKAKPTKANW